MRHSGAHSLRGAYTRTVQLPSSRARLQLRAHATLSKYFTGAALRVSALAIVDLLVLGALFVFVRFSQSPPIQATFVGSYIGTHFPAGYLGGWQFGVAMLVAMLLSGTYWADHFRRDPRRLAIAVSIAAALALWDDIWGVGFIETALRFIVTACVIWSAVYAGRLFIDWILRQYRELQNDAARTLFVGQRYDADARELEASMLRNGARSVGWVGTEVARNGLRLESPDDIWPVMEELGPDVVVIVGRLPESIFHDVVEAAAAAGCRTLLTSIEDAKSQLDTAVVGAYGNSFIEVRVPALRMDHLVMKRCLDVAAATFVMILLSPFLVLVAAAIRLDSPGRALFTQERVGLGGRVFKVFKFRTMRAGADTEKGNLLHLNHSGDPRLFKIRNDPRVTRLGVILRRWSIDELPQLWNVVLGDMSLVGPRPFPESDFAGYQEHHYARLSVKPGITGLWQIKGRSQIVDFEEVVRLDREYVERWSFWLDVGIILQTLPVVMRRSGAY